MNLIYALQDPNNPNSLARRMRKARARHVEALIAQTAAATVGCRILDLGGEPDYWRMFDRAFLESSKAHITTEAGLVRLARARKSSSLAWLSTTLKDTHGLPPNLLAALRTEQGCRRHVWILGY